MRGRDRPDKTNGGAFAAVFVWDQTPGIQRQLSGRGRQGEAAVSYAYDAAELPEDGISLYVFSVEIPEQYAAQLFFGNETEYSAVLSAHLQISRKQKKDQYPVHDRAVGDAGIEFEVCL